MVALRAVSRGGDDDGLCKSMLREVKLHSQLRHPHIVQLLEVVKDRSSAATSGYMNPPGWPVPVSNFSGGEVVLHRTRSQMGP